MRVIVFVKATQDSEAGAMPSEQMLREMTDFNEELVKAGVMKAAEGLLPSTAGKRVVFAGDETRVIDGPFGGAATEIVAGYWIWEVRSMEEAVMWARKCPNPMPNTEGCLEIRPIASADDLGDAMTPELREREKRLAEQMAQQDANA
jgi:hypothetical protein